MPPTGLARSAILVGLISSAMWLLAACGSASTPGLVQVTSTPPPESAGATTASPAAEDTPTAEPATQPTDTPAPTPEPESSPVSEATPTAGPTGNPVSDVDSAPMELRLLIGKLDADGNLSELQEGDSLASCEDPEGAGCDGYGLYFEPVQEAYIYAIQQDSTGAVFALYPHPGYSEQSNPVPAGSAFWVPEDFGNWFALDENVGEEKIFVVAGPQPIGILDKLVESEASGGSTDEAVQAEVLSWLEDTEKRGRREKTFERTVEEVSTPLPTGEKEDLETTILEATGETEFVYQVTFQHVPPAVLR